ncbi:MAG: Rid family hydrolase [Pseudomonadota bacterium]
MRRLIVPEAWAAAAEAAQMSPAISANGFLFLTGITGAGADGVMPARAADQFAVVFDKMEAVLGAAGLDGDAVVEMTTYHVGLRGHFDVFDAIRKARFAAPYPAWTAVEAGGLRREGAVVEMRIVAGIEA